MTRALRATAVEGLSPSHTQDRGPGKNPGEHWKGPKYMGAYICRLPSGATVKRTLSICPYGPGAARAQHGQINIKN